MAIHSIALEQAVDVPKQVLFQLLSDHDNLGRFFSAEYSLIKQGKPEVNGIGAVREVNLGRFRFREQIIDYKENEHLHYKIIEGAPLNEHGGWIRFESLSADKSLIHYRIKFSPRIRGTGWFIKLLLEKSIKKALANLATYGESTWKAQQISQPRSGA
ncbi:SRPBCC family protein [Photobacterium sp. MCCC 1A19761]|uniref:SRPBCC family protein n=1 Tax=Photobacterium sp. MCCC 1A19761 TaxID=3115000 RepID=UPI00307CE18C